MSYYDAVVVGAGPAGCMAALGMAKGGAAVALIDKASLPRYKTCGGGLLRRAYCNLPKTVDCVVERAFTSIQLNFLDRGLHFATTRDVPVVYMTMRSELDHLLAQEAANAGAQLIQNCVATGLRSYDDRVELKTSTGLVCARTVIVADGANSRLARAAGWAESRRLIPALECELTLSGDEFLRMAGAARFDFGVTSHGYAWVFPKERHLSVGILTMGPGRINLHQELERYLQLLAITQVVSIEKHGHVIPVSPRRGQLARSGILLVGDAAGFADPVTAEGISYAILSGQLAAQALLTQSSAREVAACYQALIETQVLPELKAAKRLATILYRWPLLRNLGFRMSGQKLCEFVTDVVMGAKSYRNAVRNPFNYLEAFGVLRRH